MIVDYMYISLQIKPNPIHNTGLGLIVMLHCVVTLFTNFILQHYDLRFVAWLLIY